MNVICLGRIAAMAAMPLLLGCSTAPERTVSSGLLPQEVLSLPAGSAASAYPAEAVDQPVPWSRTAASPTPVNRELTLPPMVVTARPFRPSSLGLLLRGQVAHCPGCGSCTLHPAADGWRYETHENVLVVEPSFSFSRSDDEIVLHLVRFR